MPSDVKMAYIKDDIRKIQLKTNLYIQSYGSAGAAHLVREVVQNSFDEVLDKNSRGGKVYISYDKKTDVITVEDDGRGFPEADYPMDIFCTKIQSGSKFYRTQSGGTSGEFGLGLTAVNALSDMFSLESFRQAERYRHRIKFENGEKVLDEKFPLKKGDKKHGTITKFRPSKKYLGPNTVIPIEEVESWIESMCYLIHRDISIVVEVYDGFDLLYKKNYSPKPFADILYRMSSSESKQIISSFSGSTEIVERVRNFDAESNVVNESDVTKDVHLDVAFMYHDGDTIVDSFCNFTNTTAGGVHLDTVDRKLCSYIQRAATQSQTDAQREKYKIEWGDVRTGMVLAINLETGAQVGFVGNAKEKIGSKALVAPIGEIMDSALEQYFTANPKLLDEYIRIAKLNAKIRIEAAKMKSATKRSRISSMDAFNIDGYIPCNNTGKKDFRELFLVEGKSASGSAVSGSDRNTQAFLMFRGVVANPFKCSLAEIMENKEWRNFVNILQCGIGKDFNLNNCYFDRLNIFTDSDVDGYGISSGMLAFIYCYLRPLIEDGRVYKTYAPLYRIDDKKNPFVINKAQMVERFQKKVAGHYKIQLIGDKEPLDKQAMYDFLQDTYDYSTILTNAAESSGYIDKTLLEWIIATLVLSGFIRNSSDFDDLSRVFSDQKVLSEYMSRLQSRFPLMRYDSNRKCFIGEASGHIYAIEVKQRMIRRFDDIIPIYNKYGYLVKVMEKNREPVIMTIGEFLDHSSQLAAKILTRYKGHGELNADQIHDSALDIANRVSVQYTLDDVEHDLGIFKILHGTSASDKKARKKMMAAYKIAPEDLDN